jgi:predicted ATPase/class 3 adenylate cyclase
MIRPVRRDLPSGTVTFLFTDVEGSTKLLHSLGAQAYADALAEHRLVIREACARHNGVEVDTQGDAFFFAFPTAPGALAAAGEMTEVLSSGPIQVRLGLHTGTPLLTEEGYVGADVHRAARIAAAGHGGQVLVSASTVALLSTATVPQGLLLTDLGEHRLKDLSAPERIHQLGGGDFPALKSLYRTNLPVPATAFVGREDELTEVVSLISGEDTRLLTLTGPGGTGKTRLALQAAAEAAGHFPHGTWWVPLAPLRDPELVLDTAAQVVGSSNGLAEHIHDEAMLCLFDNFEQVVEAGAKLAGLLSACPNLAVLVTSRERLRVSGEQTYPVPPLAEPDGVALFGARARAVDPSFTPTDAVTELCLRLDSLPLALELAAARTALFSPEQLLERLSQRLDLLKGERDADPRQRTLRATIEWSYDLLSETEQRLFARLSIFAGGCTYEAAEDVCDADPDTLQSLLDRSMLRKRETELAPRYWMLETIREYASERLQDSGEADELRHHHAGHFLALSEAAKSHLAGAQPELWLDRLELERDNFRAALAALSDSLDEETQLVLALARFWFPRGYVREARQALEHLLPRRDVLPPQDRAMLLREYAWALHWHGDWRDALPFAEEAVKVSEEASDHVLTARCQALLGVIALELDDRARARQLFEASLVALRVADSHLQIGPLMNLGGLAWQEGDYEEAKRLLNEGRALAAGGNPEMVGGFVVNLGIAHALGGDPDAALALTREALSIYRSTGSLEVPYALDAMAAVVAIQGDSKTAIELLGAADALRAEFSVVSDSWERRVRSAALAALPAVDESALEAARARWRSQSLDDVIAYALGEAMGDEAGSTIVGRDRG